MIAFLSFRICTQNINCGTVTVLGGLFFPIDHLRQELWWFLCRYGQSQGLFPKGTVKFLITEQFSFFYQTSW
jgi:hypothetical protein